MSDLKPCPFCGEAANLDATEEFRDFCYMVKCYTCGACSGKACQADRAIENWNRRPLEAEMAEALGGFFVYGTLDTRVAAKAALAKARGEGA